MPIFEHRCEKCNYEWEDIYLMKEDLPTECPKCAGPVRKLISLVSPGIVELTGRELREKVKTDAKKMKAEAMVDENKMANLVGEGNYNHNLNIKEKVIDNLTHVKAPKKKKSAK